MTTNPSVEFIRLFFKSQAEEQFAVRCAQFLAGMVGERVTLLRPDTKWSEIFEWVGSSPVHATLSAFALRKEFGADAKEAIDNAAFLTFREFVEYVCRREHHTA